MRGNGKNRGLIQVQSLTNKSTRQENMKIERKSSQRLFKKMAKTEGQLLKLIGNTECPVYWTKNVPNRRKIFRKKNKIPGTLQRIKNQKGTTEALEAVG